MQNLKVDVRAAVLPQNQHAQGTGTESFLIKEDKKLPTLVVDLPVYLQAARDAESSEEREARLLEQSTAAAEACIWNWSPEEREDHYLKQRDAASARYNAMLAEQRAAYHEMPLEQKKALLAQKRTAKAARKNEMSLEQKKALLAHNRTAAAAKKNAMSLEQKIAHKNKRRLAQIKYREIKKNRALHADSSSLMVT
jgi:hypothetical protein